MADLYRIDIRLLELLQADSSLTLETLATEVGLSMSACHRRVRILERDIIIERYGARIGATKLGLALSAFAHIVLNGKRKKVRTTSRHNYVTMIFTI